MSQLTNLTGELSQLFWLAQIPVDRGVNTPEEAALVFSGPRFFVALISGVVLAFAFQLLLTNLSVAAGISYVGRSNQEDEDDRESHRGGRRIPVYRDPGETLSADHSDHHSGGVGSTIKKIGFAVGIWTLITVSIALFVACLLAVKLSLLTSAGLGAIVGLVIWGAYFSLLVLVSSTTVGSLIGSVVNTATSGFQALLGTATAAMGARAVNQQVVSTAEAAAAAVRRELGNGIGAVDIRDSLEDYLERVRPGQIDMRRVRRELEDLVNDPQLQDTWGRVGGRRDRTVTCCRSQYICGDSARSYRSLEAGSKPTRGSTRHRLARHVEAVSPQRSDAGFGRLPQNGAIGSDQ